MRRQPDEPLRTDERARLGDRRVVLADVDAVGRACFDEIGPVVEDEERAVAVARAPERRGCGDELRVRQLLLPELDDVDASAECGIEQRIGLRSVRAGLNHQAQPGAGETQSARSTIHGAHPSVGSRLCRYARPRVPIAPAAS